MPAFTPITLALMRSTIDNYIINNTSNAITPQELRATLQTMLDFCLTYFGNQAIQDIDASSGEFTFDVQEGAHATVELTNPSTIMHIANLNEGQYCTMIVSQGGGGNAIVFDDPTQFMVVGGGDGVLTLSSGAGDVDVVSFFKRKDGKYMVMGGYNFTNA